MRVVLRNRISLEKQKECSDIMQALSLMAKTLRNIANNMVFPLIPAQIERILRKTDQGIKRWRHKQVFDETTQYIQEHMPSVPVFPDDLRLLEYALSLVKGIHKGLVCEFGVGSARTTNHIASVLPDVQIFGFDSFEGLPEDWRPGFPKGTYATRKIPSVSPNITLIKGWFHETLPGFLAEHSERFSFLHIDCDLYSSTKTILNLCQSHIYPGTVIVFDEYFNYPGWKDGEYKAFQEFIEETSLSYSYIGFCQGEEQVAVTIEY